MADPAPPKPSLRVGVFKNPKFIWLRSKTGYRLYTEFEGDFQRRLDADAPDPILGAGLLEALSHARFVAPSQDKKHTYTTAAIERGYASWVESVIRAGGYLSKRQAFNGMIYCRAKLQDGRIALQPYRHVRGDEWEGLNEDQAVVVDENAGAESLGAALRLALARCR